MLKFDSKVEFFRQIKIIFITQYIFFSFSSKNKKTRAFNHIFDLENMWSTSEPNLSKTSKTCSQVGLVKVNLSTFLWKINFKKISSLFLSQKSDLQKKFHFNRINYPIFGDEWEVFSNRKLVFFRKLTMVILKTIVVVFF